MGFGAFGSQTMALAVAFGLIVYGPTQATAADDGEIFALDQLNLRVLEWLPARGEYRDWAAVGGVYAVSNAQTIPVPFLGEVDTAGRTVAALSQEVAERLQVALTLATRPSVSIQFAQRADVFIMGGVQSPGAVPYESALTVNRAIALAGGYYRETGATLRLERDVVAAQSALRIGRYEAARSLARMARLEAELANAAAVAAPGAVASVEVPLEMIAEEQRLLDVRLETRRSRVTSIENVRKLAQDQVNALVEKSANIDVQIDSLRRELADVQRLVDRGLTVAGRGFALERSLADFEGRRIDLDISRLAAELQIGQAERDIVDVETEFRSAASTELQVERGELKRSLNGIQTAAALLQEAAVIAPERIMDRGGRLAARIEITIERTVDGQRAVLSADGSTALRPGDVVQIEMIREEDPVDLSLLDNESLRRVSP